MIEEPWVKNLDKALLLDPLGILHGNVRDKFCIRPERLGRLPKQLAENRYADFPVWLAIELEAKGYDLIILYDAVEEAIVLRPEMVQLFEKAATTQVSVKSTSSTSMQPSPKSPVLPSAKPASSAGNISEGNQWMVKIQQGLNPENFVLSLHDRIFRNKEISTAVVFRFTDRYLSFSDRQDAAEKRLSILLQKTAMSLPSNPNPDALQSRLLLLFDLEGAVPQELGSQAPFAGSARIPIPSIQNREHFFRKNCDRFYSEPGQRLDVNTDSMQLNLCASLSEGLRTQDLLSLIALSHEEQLGLGKGQFRTLLDRFRYGTRENAWIKIKNETLSNATEFLRTRVKGQDSVIADVVPTLIRAKLGLTEISSEGESSKPRGVFFFVGPTGVGKTELSKAIAELIFGDENSMVRFDMSEYSEEHQQARLVGAPPGYVGFDQGGQLPNAILEQPFSVVLFDEIEKAHGRILDKFLQILDDGRLTDGMGRTVYFSEAIIIFTSNIGTSPRFRSSTSGSSATNALGAIGQSTVDQYDRLQDLSYQDLQSHFRNEVKNFFVNYLGRPEILNRIGEDNILVFNFLNDDSVKDQIIQKQISNLANYLSDKFQVTISLTPAFCEVLKQHPNGFRRNGARGVRNLLRKLVLDKVAVDIFTIGDDLKGQRLIVDYAAKRDSIGADFQFESTKIRHDWRPT
jgi:energy-coupling factor transporter ATP-binding protein EcfA2